MEMEREGEKSFRLLLQEWEDIIYTTSGITTHKGQKGRKSESERDYIMKNSILMLIVFCGNIDTAQCSTEGQNQTVNQSIKALETIRQTDNAFYLPWPGWAGTHSAVCYAK